MATSNMHTALMEAASNGHLEVVKLLLSHNADENARDRFGNTPLTFASTGGHVEVVLALLTHGANAKQEMKLYPSKCSERHAQVVKLLIEHGATISRNSTMIETLNYLVEEDLGMKAKIGGLHESAQVDDAYNARILLDDGVAVDSPGDFGESALLTAATFGSTTAAKVLLSYGANVDFNDGTSSPLIMAAIAGHLEIVQHLLSFKANVNMHCSSGSSPLMFASSGGHIEVVQELLDYGAIVNKPNKEGHTALMEAASGGHIAVTKLLLAHDAGVNTDSKQFKKCELYIACMTGDLTMVDYLLRGIVNIRRRTIILYTALMLASIDGHVDVARLLLDTGARVNLPTFRAPMTLGMHESLETTMECITPFRPPLTFAAIGGHVELASLLLDRGANIEAISEDRYTALMEATRKGHDAIVALLLSNGADVNAITQETEETALLLACQNGNKELAEYLIRRGADIELGASTALIEAAWVGQTELVRFLLENKANVLAAKEPFRGTALLYACYEGHTNVAEMLLNHGAELEYINHMETSPLMKACAQGHLSTVQLLIKRGADVNMRTSHTPLIEAARGGHVDIVKLLLSEGASIDATAK